ncbi:MAG: TAXI family TRAP transporter solute-binding subunit [Dehalococcoidales bacterium]
MVKKDYNWPENFTVGVLPAVGGLETPNVVKKLAQVLTEDTGMNVRLAYAPDKATKFKWVHHGIADMADGGTSEYGQVLEGVWNYGNRDNGAFPLRIAWVFSKYDAGFIVRGDSHIKDIYDIKPGVKVVDMRSYLPSQRNIEGLLAWAGIQDPEKDINWVPAKNADEKIQLIIDGKADVAFALPTAPSTFVAEKSPHGIRWIELDPDKDPEGAGRLSEKYISTFGPMFRGVPSANGICSTVGTDQFCCHANADTELIYNLVKWLDENWARYKDLHLWLTQTTRQNLMEKLDITCLPCHEGLIKYVKELGLWTDAHEKRNKENEDTVARYCEASQAAMWLADEKGIVVNRDNPEWVTLWENYKKELGLKPFDFLPSLGKAGHSH